MTWEKIVGVFFAYLLIDIMYAWYTIAAAKLRPWSATFATLGILTLAAFGIQAYVEDWRYVFPAALGGGLGTYVFVSRERRKGLLEKPVVSIDPMLENPNDWPIDLGPAS